MTEPFVLENFLPYRLNQLAAGFSQSFGALYQARFGITIPEWRVLATLGRYADVSSREICESTRMDKAKVSRAVGRLIDAGLVARRANPRDNRLIALSLTARGRALHRQIVPLAIDWERRLLAALSDGDRRQLARLLSKLEDSLDGAEAAP